MSASIAPRINGVAGAEQRDDAAVVVLGHAWLSRLPRMTAWVP